MGPIESPASIGTVQRYHEPLRGDYTNLRSDLLKDTCDRDCRMMAVFSDNNTICTEGLCPTLLVFRAVPRPAKTASSATLLNRVLAIDNSTKEAEKEHGKQRIVFGLRLSGGTEEVEQSADLPRFSAVAPVIYYRTTKKAWEGPLTFIRIAGETVVVKIPRDRRIFRSTGAMPIAK